MADAASPDRVARPTASGTMALERGAGLTESICAEFFDRIPRGLQVVAAATLSAQPTLASVRSAAEVVADRHPVLASALVRARAGGWQFQLALPASVTVSQAPPGTAWRQRFTAALDKALDPGQALWRVELVDESAHTAEPAALIVVAHHAAVDGVSAATLLRELAAAALGQPLKPLVPEIVGPMEELFRLDSGRAANPGRVPDAEAWRIGQSAPVEARRLRCTMRSFPREAVQALRTRARNEGTTVTGALMAVLADARRRFAWATETVGFNIPADIRPRVRPTLASDLVGAYFSRAHVIARMAALDEDTWSRARVLEAAFREDLPGCFVRRPWAPGDVRDLLDDVCRPGRSTFDLAYLLTNLGAVDAGDAVTGMWFTTVQTAGVEAFVVSGATVGGTLHLTVAWPEPLVRPSEGEDLADALVDGLRDLCA